MSEETLSTTQDQNTFDKDAADALFLANAGNIARANIMNDSSAEEDAAITPEVTEDSGLQKSERFKKAVAKTAVAAVATSTALGMGIGLAKLTADTVNYNQDYLKSLGEDAAEKMKQQNDFGDQMDQGKVVIDIPSEK